MLAGGGGESDNAAAPAPSKPSAASRRRDDPGLRARASRSRCRPAGPTAATRVAVPGLADGRRDRGRSQGRARSCSARPTTAPRTRPCCPTICAPAICRRRRRLDLADGDQALHYKNVKLGDKTGAVFAVPTTEGVATLACIAPDETCETIASSLQITEGKPFPVGPSKAYSADVERTLGRLDKQEKSAASALNKARQAHRARSPRPASSPRAYSGAASSLGKLDVSPADTLLNAQLVAALKCRRRRLQEGRGRGQPQGSRRLQARGCQGTGRPQGHDRRARPA